MRVVLWVALLAGVAWQAQAQCPLKKVANAKTPAADKTVADKAKETVTCNDGYAVKGSTKTPPETTMDVSCAGTTLTPASVECEKSKAYHSFVLVRRRGYRLGLP